MPISFTALDFAQGHVRFIFRTEDEMNRMLVKASTSVAECKVVASILFDSPGAFCVLPKSKRKATFPLSSMVGMLEERLSRVPDAEDLEYPSEVVREERERGASLGYQVGRYAKSLRSGSFTDAFRSPLPYHEWKDKVLPQPFEAVLDNLCARSMQPWDPNRSAIVAFCRDRWNDCFADSKVAGKKVVEGTPLHASLQAIAQHWASPEKAYRISAERDPYMQALAAFLECGTQANKYPRFAKESLLKSPEYLLALYGALVGYTQFSRILLDNKMYLPSPKVVEPSGEHNHQESGGATRQGVVEGQGGNSEPKAKKTVEQPSLFDIAVGTEELVKDKGLLVCDESLCADVTKEFAAMPEARIQKLVHALQEFSKCYTSGYYGRNPEKYKQTNPDLIDHLMRCFRSPQTREINFMWSNKDEEQKFVTYLESRFACRRKSHGKSPMEAGARRSGSGARTRRKS